LQERDQQRKGLSRTVERLHGKTAARQNRRTVELLRGKTAAGPLL
jgi:hypothetical protein